MKAVSRQQIGQRHAKDNPQNGGDQSGAEENWKQVISVEPENSQAKMYLRMLERTRASQPPQPPQS